MLLHLRVSPFCITLLVCVYLTERRCVNTRGSLGSDSPDPHRGQCAEWDPGRVLQQTACSPAEVTGRTCLLVETRGEERRREGSLRESHSLDGTGIQVFTLDPCFMFVYLIGDFLWTIGSGVVTLRVPACGVFFYARLPTTMEPGLFWIS